MSNKILRLMVLTLILVMIILLVGCGNKNVLFKDDTYVITKGENAINIEVVGSYAPRVHDAAKEFINDAQPCLYVLDYKDNVLTVSSHNYDGDAKADFKLWKLNCADNITFKCITVVDDKGDVTVDNIEIPYNEYKYIGEYYTGGYFEFNTNGEVTNVSFYGDTIIQ